MVIMRSAVDLLALLAEQAVDDAGGDLQVQAVGGGEGAEGGCYRS